MKPFFSVDPFSRALSNDDVALRRVQGPLAAAALTVREPAASP